MKLEVQNPLKVMIVFGTRPEAIKMAPLVREIKGRTEFDLRVCVTGQHREMLDQILDIFDITPDFDLNLMTPGQSLTELTKNILVSMELVFKSWSPDIVLVHGDTTTAFASTLAAYYSQIPVGHVEAGLRTGNIYSPWPEEANRKLIGSLSSVHFAPTETARQNLLIENVPASTICVTGNTVVDALIGAVYKIETDIELRFKISNQFSFLNPEKKLLLVTGHRRENFGEGFESICHGLKEISNRSDIQIVYPVHMNPKVRKPVETMLGNIPNLFLIEPQDYLSFVYLMKQSHIILTDSGGIQEEAPALGKPVLVMRESTERPEAVIAGTVKLTGSSSLGITKDVSDLLDDHEMYSAMSNSSNPYGDGQASLLIANFLKVWASSPKKLKHSNSLFKK